MTTTTHTMTAADYRREAAESDARSTGIDADGYYKDASESFLSDWAGRTMASRYRACADFLEAGETTLVTALFLNGEVASTMQRTGQYGDYWVLNDSATETFGKRFFTPSKAAKSITADRKRGFTYGSVRVAGYIDRNSIIQPNVPSLIAGEYEVASIDGFVEWEE